MNNIALQGICFDEKSSFLRGPRLAPPLIRQAMLSPAYNDYAEHGRKIGSGFYSDKGDFEVSEYFDIERITASHLGPSVRLVTLGGDHSITYPVLKAYSQVYKDIEILHIDAHGDLYHDYEGDPYSHACPFARIMEGGHASRLVQVGIRAMTPHQREQAAKFGVECIEMKDYQTRRLPTFTKPIYISLDMDAFDPAFAPGVSHHEPGGFTSREVLDIIHSIKVPVIGADIVEFNPTRDPSGITAALAGKMLKELLAKMGER